MSEQNLTPGQQALNKVVDFLNKVQMGMTQGAFLHAQLEVIAKELAAAKAPCVEDEPPPDGLTELLATVASASE